MAVPFQDYYEILGVKRDATLKEIKSAYRKLARKWHPDLHTGKEKAEAEEKIRKINEAYEVLSDKDRRSKYDRLGSRWRSGEDFEPPPDVDWGYYTTGEGGFEGGGFSDFFETLFGGRRGGTGGGKSPFWRSSRAHMAQRGRDMETEIRLNLEEAYFGTTKSFQIQNSKICTECGGTGMQGRGFCSRCGGTGTTSEPKTLEVKIPAGMVEGDRIRLIGQGGEGLDGESRGDLYLKIKFLPHPVFTVRGSDLEAELRIRPDQAVFGDKVEAPTLGGTVKVSIPPGSHAGTRLRLRGKGLNSKEGNGRGNEFLRLVIDIPASLSDDERNLYRQLQEIRKR